MASKGKFLNRKLIKWHSAFSNLLSKGVPSMDSQPLILPALPPQVHFPKPRLPTSEHLQDGPRARGSATGFTGSGPGVTAL